MGDTLASSKADSIRCNNMVETRIAMVYEGLLFLLSPLWQMPLWHQVKHATTILSPTISMCNAVLLWLQQIGVAVRVHRGYAAATPHQIGATVQCSSYRVPSECPYS